jgi:hypothetical protein
MNPELGLQILWRAAVAEAIFVALAALIILAIQRAHRSDRPGPE